jgi:hypothetical protein
MYWGYLYLIIEVINYICRENGEKVWISFKSLSKYIYLYINIRLFQNAYYMY